MFVTQTERYNHVDIVTPHYQPTHKSWNRQTANIYEIAALAGQKTEIDLKNIYVRNVRIVGSTLRSRTPAVKAEILASLVRDVYPKIEAGLVKPTIHAVLPIQEAEAAHDILYKGKNVGKVVLTVG